MRLILFALLKLGWITDFQTAYLIHQIFMTSFDVIEALVYTLGEDHVFLWTRNLIHLK